MSTHRLSKHLKDHLAGPRPPGSCLGHVISSPSAAGFTAGFEQGM